MDSFKIRFNPLIPFLRLIWAFAAGSVLIRILYFIFMNFQTDPTRTTLIASIGIPLVVFLLYIPVKGLLNNSKVYSISIAKVTITDLMRFRTETVDKKMVRGFSDSKIDYRIGTFDQIIIYLVDGRKYEIMQFEQFDFRAIKKQLIEHGFNYFWSEPYQWKFPDSRLYFFERDK